MRVAATTARSRSCDGTMRTKALPDSMRPRSRSLMVIVGPNSANGSPAVEAAVVAASKASTPPAASHRRIEGMGGTVVRSSTTQQECRGVQPQFDAETQAREQSYDSNSDRYSG